MATTDIPDIPLVDMEDASPELDNSVKAQKGRGRPRKVADVTADRTPNARAKGARTKSPLPPWKAGAIATWVESLYTMAGNGFVLMGKVPYGEALKVIAHDAGENWEKLAKRHEPLRRLFGHLMETSEIGELVMTHSPLIMILINDMGLFQRTGIIGEFNDEMVNTNGRVNGVPTNA